ncbi:histidinol-phosphatase [Armatimonas sp.]|uniref:histidinol-phosphatase n=1 Tax=Armatimonas sp. TaxID=1872638 RepID=UPI00286BCD91|nr:histidinol-phosphatase [Armatimonas sp.]
MITFDYHSHNDRCGHAIGKLEDYVQQAVALGLTHFGMSDHGPAYWLEGDHAQPGIQMAVSELPSYVAEAVVLKERYADEIALTVGIEADFIEGHEETLAAWLAAHPFDYVLGSVHYALGHSVFNRRRWTEQRPERIFRDYYRQVILAAQSGLFDILSHLTVIDTYSPGIPEKLAAELYPEVAAAIAESGCIVELNTSCYRKQPLWNAPYPNLPMFMELIKRGVPLTFGSDCHAPGEIHFAHEKVEKLREKLGLVSEVQPYQVKRSQIMTFLVPPRGGG